MAAQFQEILGQMTGSQPSLELDAVVRHATQAIAGAQHAAISLVSAGREARTLYSTDDLPLRVDALQYSTGEGPCVTALTESDLVLVDDLADDDQFPTFAPGAVELGIRSMLSTRLAVAKDHRAALNFYAAEPHAFDEDQLPVAAIFGSFTSVLLLNQLQQDTIAGLENAIDSNREIGVAVGILMANRRFTREQALERLKMASQNLNRRLRDIAEEVNLTGQLPHVPERHRLLAARESDTR